MNKVEKIKAEIKKRYKDNQADGYTDVCEELFDLCTFIDSLEEEPVSEDLEEAAKSIGQRFFPDEDNIWARPNYESQQAAAAFKAGAQWQKQQDQSTIELAEDHAYLAGQEKIIDMACEFLRSHIDKQLVIYHEHTWRSRDEFIEGFKKAMEE